MALVIVGAAGNETPLKPQEWSLCACTAEQPSGLEVAVGPSTIGCPGTSRLTASEEHDLLVLKGNFR
jgi:hypothetical protein